MTPKELLRLKEDIENSRTKVAELNGQLKSSLNQLKETFSCVTVEEGKKKLDKLTKEIEQLDETIQTNLELLDEKYGEL